MGTDGNLGKGDVAFCLIVIECAADIGFLVDHVQFMCHGCQQGALQRDGKENNAEHQVEQIVFHRRTAEDCLNGKHDGSGSSQPRPGNQANLFFGRTEGRQYRSYGKGSCHKGQKRHDKHRGQEHRRQLRRRYQQSQQEEDNHLGNACQYVECQHQITFMGQIGVPHDNAAKIYAQIPIAAQSGRQGVSQSGNSQKEYGIPLVDVEIAAVQHKNSAFAQQQTQNAANGKLAQHQQRHRHLIPCQYGDPQQGQHIGHGVIGTGLHFQHGSGVVFQVQLFGTENAEYGSGVCG